MPLAPQLAQKIKNSDDEHVGDYDSANAEGSVLADERMHDDIEKRQVNVSVPEDMEGEALPRREDVPDTTVRAPARPMSTAGSGRLPEEATGYVVSISAKTKLRRLHFLWLHSVVGERLESAFRFSSSCATASSAANGSSCTYQPPAAFTSMTPAVPL